MGTTRAARLFFASGVCLLCWQSVAAETARNSEVKPAASDAVTTLRMAERAHADVYKRFGPAVVGITGRGSIVTGETTWFSGTGTVISPDGLILTTTTTAPADITELTIYFSNGRVQSGTVVETADACEASVLKTDGDNLPCMRIADSNGYHVGDPVYTWGNPFGTIQLDGAVCLAAGTISGLYNVSSVADESYYIGPVIETDAAVNPGSDGGPLSDVDGNLVGMISCAYSRTRWLGLAVPSRTLIDALPSLKKLALAERGELSGDQLAIWAQHCVFSEKIQQLEKSVVVIASGEDPAKLPSNFTDGTLAPLDKFARSELSQLEARRPSPLVATGFVVDADGTIATSSFNLGRTRTGPYFIYLPSGERVDATLLGADDHYDLALLKPAKATGLAPVQLGNASHFVVGRAVALIGRSESPGTLTMNTGTVSATNRYDATCCQVSALINYGNLGGPLIDLQGRVVGMATHLGEKTGWRQNCGVGFMLQAEHIRKLLPDLKAGKSIAQPKRPMIGVYGDIGALDVRGARIVRVLENGPAAAAGIREKDVVVAFNGKVINDWLALHRAVRGCKVGQKVRVALNRGGRHLNTSLIVGQQE
jgi:S1-C subfamily serine protease